MNQPKRNFLEMYIRVLIILHIFDKSAAIVHHGLNSIDTPAGLCHGVPVEGGHHFYDLKPVLWIRISIHFGRSDLDPHWECRSGYESRRVKMTHKSKKNSISEVLDVLF